MWYLWLVWLIPYDLSEVETSRSHGNIMHNCHNPVQPTILPKQTANQSAPMQSYDKDSTGCTGKKHPVDFGGPMGDPWGTHGGPQDKSLQKPQFINFPNFTGTSLDQGTVVSRRTQQGPRWSLDILDPVPGSPCTGAPCTRCRILDLQLHLSQQGKLLHGNDVE